jgi:hypothetical protein
MIARFRVLLPYPLFVPASLHLLPYEWEQGALRIRLFPPLQASVSTADADLLSPLRFNEILAGLRPRDPQVPLEVVVTESGPTIPANMIQIDFIRESFDRSRAAAEVGHLRRSQGDPPVLLAFEIANSLLVRIRAVTRAVQVKPLTTSTFWTLDYLDDSGTPLRGDRKNVPGASGAHVSLNLCTIDQAVWEAVGHLPVDYAPHPWETLLLDASSLLPDAGASVAIAFAALESFIEWALDQLAPAAGLPPGLWEWIKVRGNQLERQPAVSEQYDTLLRSLAGRSLKDETRLWQVFQTIRGVRNSFMHTGVPLVGKKRVTEEQATELLTGVQQIIDWVEGLLPQDLRRPPAIARWSLSLIHKAS